MASRSRGQVIPKGDRKYLVRIPQGKDAEGTRIYHSETVYGTLSAAQKRLSELLRDLDTHKLPTRTSLTYREFAESWFKTARVEWKDSTANSYRWLLDKYILPDLGETKLLDLNFQVVKSFLGKLRDNPKLGGRSVRYIHAVLRASFSAGIREGVLSVNPAVGQSLPRKQNSTSVRSFTKEQLKAFLESTKGSKDYALWCTLLGSGVRPGEGIAVEWSDLQPPALSITKAAVQVAPGKYEVQDLKTPESIRTVDLPSFALEALKEHRRTTGGLAGLVFRNEAGNLLDIAKVRRDFKKACKLAEVPDIGLYGTRHTHATQLLGAGVHVKAVASRLGHSDPAMTMRAYAHVIPEVAREAATLLDKVVSM